MIVPRWNVSGHFFCDFSPTPAIIMVGQSPHLAGDSFMPLTTLILHQLPLPGFFGKPRQGEKVRMRIPEILCRTNMSLWSFLVKLL